MEKIRKLSKNSELPLQKIPIDRFPLSTAYHFPVVLKFLSVMKTLSTCLLIDIHPYLNSSSQSGTVAHENITVRARLQLD